MATGELCLEDGDGRVVLDMEEAVSPKQTLERGPELTWQRFPDAWRGALYRGMPRANRGRIHG